MRSPLPALPRALAVGALALGAAFWAPAAPGRHAAVAQAAPALATAAPPTVDPAAARLRLPAPPTAAPPAATPREPVVAPRPPLPAPPTAAPAAPAAPAAGAAGPPQSGAAAGSGGTPPAPGTSEEQSLAVCDRSQAAGPRALRIKPSEWEEYRRAGATQGGCAVLVAAGAPSTAVVALPSGGQASVVVGQNVVDALQAAQPEAAARLVVEAARLAQPPAAEVFGGGRVEVVGAPLDIKLELHDAAGALMAPAADVGSERVALTLPLLQPADPDSEFHWMYEVLENGIHLGYTRSTDEAAAGESVTISLRLDELQGTLFVPASITPGYVQNHDPLVHTWSGPTVEARDFGFAGPQWTTFTVAAPQVRDRLLVWSPVVSDYAWIDVAGVGPSGPPAGPPE
jgi:hypothetical protein